MASVDIKTLNAPREGKKCLVLDIDYTLFDLGSAAERPEELGRPYLHHFLASAYEFYDLVIWSATSMKWVEVKMHQLGVTNNPNYKIAFMLDHKAMITVRTEKHGKQKQAQLFHDAACGVSHLRALVAIILFSTVQGCLTASHWALSGPSFRVSTLRLTQS